MIIFQWFVQDKLAFNSQYASATCSSSLFPGILSLFLEYCLQPYQPHCCTGAQHDWFLNCSQNILMNKTVGRSLFYISLRRGVVINSVNDMDKYFTSCPWCRLCHTHSRQQGQVVRLCLFVLSICRPLAQKPLSPANLGMISRRD